MSTCATGLDIYNYPRRLELALQNLQEDAKISPTNRRLILAFHERLAAEGLSTPRVVRCIQVLQKLAEELGKGFATATREDITHLIAQVENRPISDWTKQSYKVVLKKFYKWLRHSKNYPKEVNWIRTPSRIRNSILPTDLLNEDDIKRLASAATTPRDRALVPVLYESGCRIGEILSLRIRNVEFDKYGAVLMVTGKTGMRRVRIIMSTPALGEWLNAHPHRGDPDSALWVGEGRGGPSPVRYEAVRTLIQRLSERAGIRKPVNPYKFRHSRATFLAKRLSDAQMDQYLGWVPGSRMHSIYYHLAGRDVDGTLLSMYGLASNGEERPTLKAISCSRCKEPCAATANLLSCLDYEALPCARITFNFSLSTTLRAQRFLRVYYSEISFRFLIAFYQIRVVIEVVICSAIRRLMTHHAID
jgi:integrase